MTDLPRAVGIFSNYPNTPSLEDKTSYTLEDSANPSTHTDGDYRKVKRTWYGVIWDTWDLPKPERRLLFKVDAVLLTFASLGYFLKEWSFFPVHWTHYILTRIVLLHFPLAEHRSKQCQHRFP